MVARRDWRAERREPRRAEAAAVTGVGDAHGGPRVRHEQRERSGTRATTGNGSSARGQIDPDARNGSRTSTPPTADSANARPGRGAHRKQAGPVRQTVEVVVSGAAGMALVGGLLVLLHAGGMPPAVAAESPPPRTHAPTGILTVQPAAPINALGGGDGANGSGGNVTGGVQQTAAGAAAQVTTAVPVAPPSSRAAESGGASQSPISSPDASASPPHSATPSPSPSGSQAGALGGAVSGVVGGLAGLVGQLVGGLSGGSH